MELMLENGDYCPDGLGGMTRLSGEDAVLQRVHFRLVARRGAFPLMPTMGSQLYRVLREKPSDRLAAAKRYVCEALEEETELSVESVSLECEGEKILLTVEVNWQGESLTVTETLFVL